MRISLTRKTEGKESGGKTERQNAEKEVSAFGWKLKLGARAGRDWWRSVVVQKSSSARRQRVRRGPWPWVASPPQSHGHKPPTPFSTTSHPTQNPLAGTSFTDAAACLFNILKKLKYLCGFTHIHAQLLIDIYIYTGTHTSTHIPTTTIYK